MAVDELGNVAVFERALKSGGKFYVDIENNGDWVYAFESHDASLSPIVETIEIADTEGCIQGIGATATKSMKIEGKLSTYTYSPDVIALTFAGVKDISGDAAATAVAVVLEGVKQGAYRDIGYVGITTLMVKDETDTQTYVSGTDYTLEASSGMIGIIRGGAIVDGSEIHLTVSAPANTLEKVELLKAESRTMPLKFVGCPTLGDKIEFVLYKVKMIADGDVLLKGEEFNSIGISFTALTDQSQPSGKSQYGRYRILP